MIDFHPLANLFPLIEGDEFDHLVEDIRANGLRDPIILLGGQVLDGRNRYRAGMLAERVEADDTSSANFREFDPETDGEPLAFVLSKNLARRHLNESQRAMVAARIANMPGHRPGDKSANLQTSQPSAARQMNVSTRLVASAKQVQDKGTDALKHAVDAGKLPASAGAQAAKLPAAQQDEIAKNAEAGKANVVRTVIKQAARDAREVALGAKQAALPDKKYGVILMDPEWQFQVWSRETGLDRAADNHYPTSDQRLLLMREIGKISAKDCMCAMWVTDLTNGIRLMESYGFQVKSRIIWVKDIIEGPRNEAGQRTYVQVGPAGTGYWARDRAEILLIGTRGDFPAPAPGTQGESVWFAARGRHSEKPDEAYLWIEKHWPNLPKIELNARAARPGWDRWGNEAPPNSENAETASDPLFDQALAVMRESGKASAGYVQRRLEIGYNRAAAIIELMEHKGLVTAPDHRGVRAICEIPVSATQAAAVTDGEPNADDAAPGAFLSGDGEAEENHPAPEPVGQTSDLGVTAGETAPVSESAEPLTDPIFGNAIAKARESAEAIAASLGTGPRWQNQISKTADLDLDRDLPPFLRRRPVAQ